MKNTFFFGILLLLMQIAVCIIYGLLITQQTRTQENVAASLYSLTPVFVCVAFFMLVLLGMMF